MEQYAGGLDGRTGEIEAGATRTAREIIGDVSSSADRLDSMFSTVPEYAWARPVRTVRGGEHPVSLLPFRRRREVEVHLVDLALGATPADWTVELVEHELPELTARLAARCDQRALMAWILGRGPAPELRPWA